MNTKPLTTKQKAYLRSLAHHRSVIITVGNAGLTAPVIAELELALARLELLKVKLPSIHRDQRSELAQKIATTMQAELVQEIGRIGVCYRRAEKPKIEIPR